MNIKLQVALTAAVEAVRDKLDFRCQYVDTPYYHCVWEQFSKAEYDRRYACGRRCASTNSTRSLCLAARATGVSAAACCG